VLRSYGFWGNLVDSSRPPLPLFVSIRQSMIPGYYDAAEARRGVAIGPFLLLAASPGNVVEPHQPALCR